MMTTPALHFRWKYKTLQQITQKDIAENPSKKEHSITPQTTESVRNLKHNGWTIPEIAKSLNLSVGEVQLILDLPE